MTGSLEASRAAPRARALAPAIGTVPASAGAGAAVGRVPDFFVVGHAKSGTTALYRMLQAHPRIYMPMKETWFFVPELHSRFRKPGGVRPDTLEQYLALFAPAAADQLAGEASPSYLASETAPARIAEVAPDARIVAILREPASFLRSLHLQLVQTHVETETDLHAALQLEDARRRGERLPRNSPRPQALLYSDYVKYAQQLRRYREAFGHDRVLALIYDDFRADNVATVRAVLRFVGVDDPAPVEAVEANPTVSIRYPRLHQAVHELLLGRGPVARAAKRSIKALVPRRPRRAALELVRGRVVVAPAPPVDEGLMAELRRRFAPEVVALSEYLGRDLVSLWGYDDRG
jgi:hypothetical protein